MDGAAAQARPGVTFDPHNSSTGTLGDCEGQPHSLTDLNPAQCLTLGKLPNLSEPHFFCKMVPIVGIL